MMRYYHYFNVLVFLLCGFSLWGQDKKFVFVIPSYNNAQWYEKNLGTIFSQNYQNYRIIYIDDCSPDGTGELVEKYCKEQQQMQRVILIKNKQRQRALANIYNAIQSYCQDDEIVINYDGDDWLAHDNVLSLLNTIYQDKNVWITYGQFQNWPTQQLGYCKPIPQDWVTQKLYRKKWWMPGQLRTFYTWLFKQIQVKDLLFQGPYFQGLFFPANCDLALYYPMMEMAGEKFKFIDEIIYIRNVQTPLNDFKANHAVQILGSKLIRAKPPYQTLTTSLSYYFEQFKNNKADILIFSHDPLQLKKHLASLEAFVVNKANIAILYQADNEQIEAEYQALSQEIPLKYIRIDEPYSQVVSQAIASGAHDHIVLLTENIIFHRCIDLAECIYHLEKTFAFGFYLGLHAHKDISFQGNNQAVAPLNILTDGIGVWGFDFADEGDWKHIIEPIAGLYRKFQLQEQVCQINSGNREEFKNAVCSLTIKGEIGLCYLEPHASVSL